MSELNGDFLSPDDLTGVHNDLTKSIPDDAVSPVQNGLGIEMKQVDAKNTGSLSRVQQSLLQRLLKPLGEFLDLAVSQGLRIGHASPGRQHTIKAGLSLLFSPLQGLSAAPNGVQ